MGKINLVIGPMYAGKTTELQLRYKRNEIAGMKCVMIKFTIDTRYSKENVISHNNTEVKAISTDLLGKLDNIVQKYDCIYIDEIQFFKDGVIFCNKWANDGKTVECSGLNGDFKQQKFDVVADLLPLADDVIMLKAKREGGKGIDASFSMKITKSKTLIEIGGIEKYKAVDREYLNKKKKAMYKKQKIEQFAEYLKILINYKNDDINEKKKEIKDKEKDEPVPKVKKETEKINKEIEKLIEEKNNIEEELDKIVKFLREEYVKKNVKSIIFSEVIDNYNKINKKNIEIPFFKDDIVEIEKKEKLIEPDTEDDESLIMPVPQKKEEIKTI